MSARTRGALVALTVLTACATGRASSPGGAGPPSPARPRSLQVLAASSLSESFTEMARAFETRQPAVRVNVAFGSSSTLAEQVDQGAPADLYASADEAAMRRVTDAGTVTGPRVFARNRLEIAVAPGNPEHIAGPTDLARPAVALVLCAPEAPCGRLAALALQKAGVSVRPRSLEENVKAVLSKVLLGEADAGIVYVTDVQAAGGRVHGVPMGLPADPDLDAVYSLAVTTRAAHPQAARAFADFVLSHAGQRVLARSGFLPA